MASHTTGSAGEPAGPRPMSLEEIRESYADCAPWMDRFDWLDRRLTGRYRRELFGDASGRVLDVACGNGVNFPYLPSDVDLVGIDISPEMLASARERLDDLEVDGTVRRMDAGDLAFDDDSFDTVISSLSTCTFPDPVAALEEMDRVCRPGGRILLFEHGRSDVGPIARFQDRFADVHYASAGCRWNQEPLKLVLRTGLPVREAETRALGILTLIEARPSQESIVDTIRARLSTLAG
ncbi:phosphatidylethanolamine N-methyltransferase /phosphatidyl-N-methylethanolamine N-methyltransferase [Halobiforma haloterrestris]|uniref:Phosphatidylethanolamine N-methyltransferase /phosphatidyl-N-methylethanolamine N-methyltransferase n=1 Tax=Natronobacterium haloterrestre TaxID=148448 RepID=A0A1I1HGH4_NATHA|nr:class I SAM-dependent methyltransferase [Halobiforma haloterrestris]SFC20210.1 phosphatidylethanolamine N-methyltransferase /phosphatidyl-N-methylethanolamine N-methyltransferase [Halobiforma haloterrestris]